MYFRKKVAGKHTYLQIVHGYREDGRVRQRVVATLGRLDRLQETGQLDGLLTSGARFSESVSVIGEHQRGALTEVTTRKIGPGLVFDRLWKETGIRDGLAALLAKRRFQFDVERAIFLTVVHRIFDTRRKSDREADKWKTDYVLSGVGELDLHQLYRAMAWLGEELPETEQEDRTPFAPRCTKDLLEERLFAQRRTLFTSMVLAFFDTTSIYFEGEGGATIGQYGKSKDHRPDRKQIVVGLVIDSEGRPICCELWPGNTTDVKTLLPLLDRLRHRFGVRQICIVADRGMISKEILSALEDIPDVEYILGARMRAQKEVKIEVLGRAGRYRVVHPPRSFAKDPSPLKVKEVYVDKRRYVVCYNEEQARKDRLDREKIVESLEKKLRQGEKSLVGNRGYRRYLKPSGKHFSIDTDKIEAEARYDGKWVLRTNNDERSAANVALTYKELWMVESLFRTIKSLLGTRPVFHKMDETIRGHVFSSYLALNLMRELQDRMEARGWTDAEWTDVLRNLDELSETEVETSDGKRYLIRSEAKGWCGRSFQAAGVALPPTLRPLPR